MITQHAVNYAKVLFDMQLSEKSVEQAKNLLFDCNELIEVLENPVIRKQEKDTVIDSLFHKEICSFLKLLCDNRVIGTFSEIAEAYDNLLSDHKNILKVKLGYAVKPDEEQLDQIKKMLCEKYQKTAVVIETEQDTSLIGGYVLYVGDMEYDKSIKGALSEMQKTLIRR
jgi:F-type H+-transporting ATPase subunit delta